MKLLVIDNYDSFTYNLVHLIEKCSDIPFDVRRNDEISLEEVAGYDKILISPGPGLPKDAGIIEDVIRKYSSSKSILGICLGMQAIGEVYGAGLKNLDKVCHGIHTPIKVLNNDLLFKDCPAEFNVGRYHSWVVSDANLPECLEITALSNDENIMALRHKQFDVRGVQFHPESILSQYGEQLMRNWLGE